MAIIPRRKSPETNQMARRAFDPFELMQSMMRRDPFEAFGALTPFFGGGGELMEFVPPFDVTETRDAYLFKGDLPGVNEKNIEVTLSGNRLTIAGEKSDERLEEHGDYYAHERMVGSFRRSFTLPGTVDTDNVKADLKDGVLTVSVAKKSEDQPKKIELRTVRPDKEKAKA